MIERISPIGPSAFPPDNIPPLAQKLRRETEMFISIIRSSEPDLSNLARTIITLSDLSQECEKC